MRNAQILISGLLLPSKLGSKENQIRGNDLQPLDPMDSGEARLKALGYKQELKRDFTLVSNAAISFSIISTLLGITGDCSRPAVLPAFLDCQRTSRTLLLHTAPEDDAPELSRGLSPAGWCRLATCGIQQWGCTLSCVGLDPCVLHEYDRGKCSCPFGQVPDHSDNIACWSAVPTGTW